MNLFVVQTEPPSNWHRGCAECHQDVGACCEALLLPCCYLGFHSAASIPQYQRESDWDCGTCCAASVMSYMLGPFGCSIFALSTRTQVAMRFNIADGAGCPIACFCPVCSMVQVTQELKYRGLWNGSVCSSADNVDKRTGRRNTTGSAIVQQMVGGGMAPAGSRQHLSPFSTTYPTQQQQQQQQQQQMQGGYPTAVSYPGLNASYPAPPPHPLGGYQGQYYGAGGIPPPPPPVIAGNFGGNVGAPPLGYGGAPSSPPPWNQNMGQPPIPQQQQQQQQPYGGGYYYGSPSQFQPQPLPGFTMSWDLPTGSGAAPNTLPPPSFRGA